MVNVELDLDGATRIALILETASGVLDDEVLYAVGTPLQYGVYQEVGTSFHGAQPFMQPAARKAQANVQTALRRHDDMESALEWLAEMVRDESKRRAPVRTGRLKRSIHMERRK